MFDSCNPVYQVARHGPLAFSRRNDVEVLRQVFDEVLHFSRTGPSGQFRQNDGTATNDMRQSQNLVFEAPGPQVIDVDGCIEYRKISCVQNRGALPCRYTAQ